MTYQELYDYYMANGGNTSGGDGSGYGPTAQVTLPDGRILMPDGQGRLSIMEVDRNQGGTNVTAYNPDGTTQQYFQEDNLNRRSPLQQLGLAVATLGTAAAIGNAGPYLNAYLSGSGASEGLVSAASSFAPETASTTFGASNATLPTTLGTGGGYLGPGGATAGGTGLDILGSGVPYGAEDILAGNVFIDAPATTASMTAPLAVAPTPTSVTAPTTIAAPSAPPAADARTVLERILSGSGNIDDLLRVVSGITGAVQQNNAGNALLERANAATPNRDFYEGQLRQTYENPASYLDSPEYKAIQASTLNKLQRSDAAGGRLANDYGRQLGLNNQGYENLNRYRSTLGTIVGQNQNVYSGQNSIFGQGTNMTNSAANPIINAATSRPGNTGSGSILSQLLAELQRGQ